MQYEEVLSIIKYTLFIIGKMSKQKKQALEKILEALIPYWDLAEWFLLILNKGNNDELIEKLYQEILKEIRNIDSESQQKQIKTALQKLKEKSEQVCKEDENEAEIMLEDFINNI